MIHGIITKNYPDNYLPLSIQGVTDSKNTWPKPCTIPSILKNKEKYIMTIATCHREINEKGCMI